MRHDRDERAPGPVGVTRTTAVGLLCTVVALSSVAPFVQFGGGLPTVHGGDLVAGAAFLALWAPFVAVLVLYAHSPWAARPVAGAAGHLVLLFTLPALHAAAFLAASDAVAGAAAAGFGLRVQVFTMLGTLQYLVLVTAMAAARAGRAAEQSRRRAADLELARARLESELARAQMNALRAQLQPHFLFNTLNSIAVLATSDAPRARRMVGRLSELLRAVLADDERATVSLRREVELLRAYVEIQQERFGDRVRVTIDAEPCALRVPVPPLLLQPLVENAFRHAIADREEGGAVAVSARLTAADGAGRLELAVVDDGPGPDPAAAGGPGEARGHGLGLRNTRDRLRTLYGRSHHFAVGPAPSGGYAVRISLPASGPTQVVPMDDGGTA